MIKSVVGEKVVVKPFNDKWITNEYLSWLKDDCVNEYLKSGCKTTTIEEVAAYVNSIQEKKNDFLFAIIGMNGTHVGNIRLTCVDSTARFGIFLNVTVTTSSTSWMLTTLIPDGNSL